MVIYTLYIENWGGGGDKVKLLVSLNDYKKSSRPFIPHILHIKPQIV